mmetsp:Transcript_63664/g.75335  ORF Transcript_63664/g.75335 Transcript_63664/m.75335 type:complete len:194 (+) Transcript_63664:339-920(+)
MAKEAIINNLLKDAEILLDKEGKCFWEINEGYEIEIGKHEKERDILEWINDDSFEALWKNKFGLKSDDIEEEYSSILLEYFNERVSFLGNNEDNIGKTTNRIDILSNLEWMEDDVFETKWAMHLMFSDYEDNERVMQIMNEIEVEIEVKRRKKRKAHESNQLENYYCKPSKELSLVSRKIDIDLSTPRIIWDP